MTLQALTQPGSEPGMTRNFSGSNPTYFLGRGSKEPLPAFQTRNYTGRKTWQEEGLLTQVIQNLMRSEKELLSKARRLDDRSLIEIYQRFSPGLYRYAARLLGDPDLAEDCVAETFSRLIESLNNGRGPFEYLQAYLYQIAHNWITDQFRQRTILMPESYPIAGRMRSDPASIVQDKIEFDRVRTALAQMKPDLRQVIVLKYLEGWSNQEIAASIGRSRGNVRVLHHRGVRQLKRLLAQREKVF